MFKLLLYAFTLSASLAAGEHNKTTRIIKGISCDTLDVVLDLLDYVVSLSTSQLDHFCCGSLIKPKYVLTAAHCTIKYKWIYVVLHKDNPNRKKILVKKTFVHPDYDQKPISIYDIAVLKMIAPAPASLNIHYAKLGGLVADQVELQCPRVRIAGWGYINSQKDRPKSLMCVEIPVIKVDICTRIYRSPIGHKYWVCTFSRDGRDACKGDSGSPVICPSTGEVIGVHSFGRYCGDGQAPAASVRVDRFRGFIDEVISRSAAIPATTPTTLTYMTGVVIIWMKWTLY